MTSGVSILGGYCTDFARNCAREGLRIDDLMREAAEGAMRDANIAPAKIGAVHIGNFTGELFANQGHLGGVAAAIPSLEGRASARHEAACASGSVAMLAAMADIECNRYEAVLVVGVEQMRNVPGDVAAKHLGVAARAGESEGARYLWPAQFDAIQRAYRERHGLERDHLVALSRRAYVNARSNTLAQTRKWTIGDETFAEGDTNPIVEGELRRSDCAQITDGACAVVLGRSDRGPKIRGWGHHTAPITLAAKLDRQDEPMFPWLRLTIKDALRRADVSGVDAVELHDCFAITHYVILDHLGLGSAAKLVASDYPSNLSGGLMGMGHPVGATGVRMVWDAAQLVHGYGRSAVQTVNIGGSFTTCVSFVVGT